MSIFLGDDMLALIFSFVPFSCWVSVICTCKTWYRIGLKVYDPSQNDNYFLKKAFENGYLSALVSLLNHPRVQATVDYEDIFLRSMICIPDTFANLQHVFW